MSAGTPMVELLYLVIVHIVKLLYLVMQRKEVIGEHAMISSALWQ